MQLVLAPISLLRRPGEGRPRPLLGRRKLSVRTTLGFSTESETVIRCLKGKLWITDGRTGDVILPEGGNFIGTKGAVIVVEALEESVVEIRRG